MSLDLGSLNANQRQAVQSGAGSSQILAGPGTGKTHTLAFRIAFLLEEKGLTPEAILALTFTQKAAREMRVRVASLIGRGLNVSGPWVGTFRALGLEILRQHGEQIGLSPDFRLLSAPEQTDLVKEALRQNRPKALLRQVRAWVRCISEQKNRIGAEEEGSIGGPDGFADLFQAYEQIRQENQALDYDDLVLKPLELFRICPHLREAYQDRFKAILVDEFQDINLPQYRLLQALSGPEPNLWVIGDADQAIYAFRGSSVEHFLNFRSHYPDAQTIALSQNYRSTRTILSAAQTVIAHNRNRLASELFTANGSGDLIRLLVAPDEHREARLVAREIARLVGGLRMESCGHDGSPCGFNDIAILYRRHQLARPFSEALRDSGIPFQVIGGPVTEEDALGKDLVLFLKVVAHPADDQSFQKVLASVIPELDAASQAQLCQAARNAGFSLQEYLQSPDGETLFRPPQRQAFQRFGAWLAQARELSRHRGLEPWLRAIGTEWLARSRCGLGKDDPPGEEALSDYLGWTRFFPEGTAAEQLPAFLETLCLWQEGETHDPRAQAVTLITLHGSKGLEFPVVFLVGMEADILPGNGLADGQPDLEEERRLFYVGMTRAREKLYLSYSRIRTVFGRKQEQSPSPFLSEVPPELVRNLIDPEGERNSKKPRAKQLSLFS